MLKKDRMIASLLFFGVLSFMFFPFLNGISFARSRATLSLSASTECQGEVREFCYDEEDWFYNRATPYLIVFKARLLNPEGQPLPGVPIIFIVDDEVKKQEMTGTDGTSTYGFKTSNDGKHSAVAIVGSYTTTESGVTQFNRDVDIWNISSNQVSVNIRVPELAPDLQRPPVSKGGLKVNPGSISFNNASLTGGDWQYVYVVSGTPPFNWDNLYKEYGEVTPRGLWGEVGVYTVRPRALGLFNADLLLGAQNATDTVVVTDADDNRVEVGVLIDYLTFSDVTGQLP